MCECVRCVRGEVRVVCVCVSSGGTLCVALDKQCSLGHLLCVTRRFFAAQCRVAIQLLLLWCIVIALLWFFNASKPSFLSDLA